MDNEKNKSSFTAQIYYDYPYLTELDSKVTSIEQKGSQYLVELESTIFYPEGGGQPSDQGEIVGPHGRLGVEQVRSTRDGHILHQGKLTGVLVPGEAVKMAIKWASRHKNMRVHSAGHLVHDVLMGLTDRLTPTKGNHGQKAFLEYAGPLDPEVRLELEAKINEMVERDVQIITRDTAYEEIAEKCRFVPPGLPRDKRLRLIQIGEFDPMPDGGVQVKSTREIGAVVLHSISAVDDTVVIRYGVAH
jgi:alanyl-tRNA synthetase